MGFDLRRFDRRRWEAGKRRARTARLGGFDPRQIASIAAGYFWDPTATTGSGATITLPEGNGKSSYNLVTPAANTAPTTGTLNAQTVMQFTNGVPDQLLRTSATVQRGWSGATYFAAWVQASAAPGSIFGHWRTANNFLVQINPGDSRINGDFGAGATDNRFDVATFGATPFFVEAVFDPALAATARFAMAIDRVALNQNTANAIGTTLVDTSEYMTQGGVSGDNTTFNYTADFKLGMVYLANGIPSSAERNLIYSHRRLK